jgi:glycosyltransferase involved in cell wall biosynthesis
MSHFIHSADEVHLASTFECEPPKGLASYRFVPVGLSRRRSSTRARGGEGPGGGWGGVRFRTWLRDWLGPLTVRPAVRLLQAAFDELRPDLVHAMRIPFEGILAAAADPPVPLLISSWGNDFTLHAGASPFLGRQTRSTLGRADGMHADCQRDLRLAWRWGFPRNRLQIVLPGNGGVARDIFHPGDPAQDQDGSPLAQMLGRIPPMAPVIVNPRGLRVYVRQETFFASIPGILERFPQAVFVCPAMADEPEARRWVSRIGVENSTRLLPRLSPQGMAAVFRRAQVAVSPSQHDGTPNTLLEAMACGSFPVAGDLESVREWIEPGENGLLFNPSDPAALVRATVDVLADQDLREKAARRNQGIVADRADRVRVMKSAEAFYRQLAPAAARTDG